jgi:hypothetical protein
MRPYVHILSLIAANFAFMYVLEGKFGVNGEA